jgi:putative ABC transport system permease protein
MRSFFLATYLAIKEVMRNKGRFFLVALVIALITVLVLFIAALGEGLSNANRQYVANLDAQLIVFLEKSEYSINSSRLETNTVKSIRRVEGVADAGPIYTSNSQIVSLPEPLKITILAVEADRPGMPPLLDGRYFRGGEAREAVMDASVAERTDLKIGDEIEIRSTQGTKDEFYTLKIVGLVDEQAYSFQPTLFLPAATWELVRPQSESDLNSDTPNPNIIAVKLNDPTQVEQMKIRLQNEIANIEVADIETTINNIPGYTAQQGTVQTQGVFTLLIGILVIGGFFQIQILQKVPQIGVLKAIGSSNFVVGISAVIQIIIVTAIGVGIGSGLNYLFSLVLPAAIPLAFNGAWSLVAILLLLFIGPLGGMVSIIYAVRIEPLKALRLG